MILGTQINGMVG